MIDSQGYPAKIGVVFGTRPEAIKMAPVFYALRSRGAQNGLAPRVYVSAQHREMLDQVLSLFDITPDADLNVMRSGQKLEDLTALMLRTFSELFSSEQPDVVLVHGDTTTALAAALAAYYQQIPVGHVEAGLRTNDRYSPFPEEMNRRLVDAIATYHFAPTARSVENLLAEGISRRGLLQTGNTGIDALLQTVERRTASAGRDLLQNHPCLERTLTGQSRLVLVTSHRRENFGVGLENICRSIRDLIHRFEDIEVAYPVHLNPNVQSVAARLLAGQERIHLLQPLDYDHFCCLMSKSHIILTDSGGIQEEAPTLNKPVLVLRDTSERPEAVEAGVARVVGTQRTQIVAAASRLLEDEAAYRRMAAGSNPYGDGHAAERIVEFLSDHLHARRKAS